MDALVDLVLRMEILETWTGRPSGTWSANPIVGARAARGALGDSCGPQWFDLGPTRFVSLVRQTIEASSRYHGVAFREEDVEEILQEIVGGLTTKGGIGHSVGSYLREDDKTCSMSHACSLLQRHTLQRARDRYASGLARAERDLRTILAEEPESTIAPPDAVYEVKEYLEALDEVLSGASGARPSDLRVLRVWMEDPTRSKTEIGEEIGTSGVFVSAALRRALGTRGLAA